MTSSPYKPPPQLPKWMLHLQVWLLRHRLMGPMGKEMMAITTTGRKSGKRFSVPIGYVRDGDAYVALNSHARSNWYKNALVNPQVSLNVQGREFPAHAEDVPVSTPEQVNAALEPFRREQPGRFEGYFQIPAENATPEQLAMVGEHIRFMRFVADGHDGA